MLVAKATREDVGADTTSTAWASQAAQGTAAMPTTMDVPVPGGILQCFAHCWLRQCFSEDAVWELEITNLYALTSVFCT